MTIQLLIADDHELVREGLRATFSDTNIDIVGEATTCEEAIRLAFSCAADVMLLDISMPGGDGFAVLRRVRSELPLAVVIYSMHTREHYVRRAHELGAHAYVPKLAPRDRLVQAIQAASRGESCWDEELTHTGRQC
jgi:DNA-binding NarL/FixJ family response regulator